MQQPPPDRPKAEQVTALLRRVADGEQAAGSELMRVIEAELHKIASHHMRKERKDHTLQTTALVNEAYLRLIGHQGNEWRDRSHFFAVASHVMRRVLIDHARSHKAKKRHGRKVDLDIADVSLGPVHPNILDVDRALNELAEIAPREARLVELRFFGGLSSEEAAAVLNIAPRTADKDWALARSWLRRRLGSMVIENSNTAR
jgi:RNA polymerase sigma factor (TIGR02999 family)